MKCVYHFCRMENCVPSVVIPAPEYFCNVVVFPAPATLHDVPKFYLLENVPDVGKYQIGSLQVKLYPGSVYCLLPSNEKSKGSLSVYPYKPSFLDSFTYCVEINPKSVVLSTTANEGDSPEKDVFRVPVPLTRQMLLLISIKRPKFLITPSVLDVSSPTFRVQTCPSVSGAE